MLNYTKILNLNMINVLRDILKYISKNGLKNNNHIYITFLTNHKDVIIPNWLKERYPKEMTIVIQYEYYDLKINEDFFEVTLSFDNYKANLKIYFDAIISFADPSANFGLKLKEYYSNKEKKDKKEKNEKNKDKKNSEKSNILNFSNFKKS